MIKKTPFLTGLLFLFGFLLTTFLSTNTARALSGSEFKPGHIIDDAIFYDSDSMTVGEIQAFLDSKVPVCDTNHAETSSPNDSGQPYICLKDFTQTVSPIINGGSDLCTGSISGGTKTSARIIYDVAKACGINPKVLIVLLQKEQSLVTDDWPWDIQYRSATGYGCPDTAPCDSEYYGFFNQVYQAAKAFRRYEANPNNYNYQHGRTNTILWHPNASCGTSQVFIENQATASLYIYTPYRPNAAALNNLYGTGNSCSSYGNRNFWRIFNDWFGPTLLPVYKAELLGKSDLTGIKPGMRKQVWLVYKNVGTATWCGLDAPVSEFCPEGGYPPTVLAATKPLYRDSIFNGLWDRSNRPLLNFTRVHASQGPELPGQQYVRRGQKAVFVFDVVGPMDLESNTLYDEWFRPVKQHATLMETLTRLQFKTPSLSLKSERIWSNGQRNAKPGWELTTTVKLKNTGNVVWYDKESALPGVRPLVLSTVKPNGRASIFGANYETAARATSELLRVEDADGNLPANQNKVLPGHMGIFQFTMTVPHDMEPGIYSEWVGLKFAGMPNVNTGSDVQIKIKVWSN